MVLHLFHLFHPFSPHFRSNFSRSFFLSSVTVVSFVRFSFSRWPLVKSDTLCDQPWRIRHVETHRRHAIDETKGLTPWNVRDRPSSFSLPGTYDSSVPRSIDLWGESHEYILPWIFIPCMMHVIQRFTAHSEISLITLCLTCFGISPCYVALRTILIHEETRNPLRADQINDEVDFKDRKFSSVRNFFIETISTETFVLLIDLMLRNWFNFKDI